MKNSHSDYNTEYNSADIQSCPHTDLACESGTSPMSQCGSHYSQYNRGWLQVAELEVERGEGERRSGRQAGTYITVYCPVINGWSDIETDEAADIIAELIQKMCRKVTGRPVTPDFKVLVAGLGNRFITADAVGPRTADLISVTGHIMGYGTAVDSIGCCRLYSIHPGVTGQTGIEAAGIIRGAADRIKPDAVIAVDALASRSTGRLAATIQLTDTGIRPGSGIGNRRSAVDRESVGYPVVAIGVPTVVDSATLVYDALEKAGLCAGDERLSKVLREGSSFFVSPRDSDVITDTIAKLLSLSINRAFFADGLQSR